ncbi:polyphosphate kinase 2 [Rhodosalinus halophilus]|uniref:ADP/GDP-polyphosphate phosphotransferase n=1 Tax=Rhodosalinus halophilus TaxID=2259333 RepID=A0A365U938_9RHOB|nr:polyphosphate kinase 2 [Rhodosalinus halophilus]RBI85057.1 polyphosphate kinase 2 [Rhodosalinus halophilus]
MPPLPFDGAISAYYTSETPQAVRQAIETAEKNDLIGAHFPYTERLGKRSYKTQLEALQIELAKLQRWAKEEGARVAVIFEGRDAAGKGGTIKRFRANMNPRVARLVALPKPSDREATEWYFQRYVEQLPAAGEIVLFDRSWYNRGVVEHVFDFCTPAQREHFFHQVPDFEKMLVDDGVVLIKLWLNVSRAEQLRRVLARERDPLKQWKVSWIDVEGLKRWEAYTDAIRETLTRSHSAHAPWCVIRSDDKRRARLEAIRAVLSRLDYARKDDRAIGASDPAILGGPELWRDG